MKLFAIPEKRISRAIAAVLIGLVLAGGSFLMQRTAQPLSIASVNPENIAYGPDVTASEVLAVHNGINQINITGYSGIYGVRSTATTISFVAVPQGGEAFTGYPIPTGADTYPQITLKLGGKQEYSRAGILGSCYAGQLPPGVYNIGILTINNADGKIAYTVTDKTFEAGLYDTAMSLLYFLLAFAGYSLFALAVMEWLHRGRRAPPGEPLPAGDEPGRHSLLSILNLLFLAVFFWIFLNVTFANVNSLAGMETYKALFTVLGALLVFIVMYSAWFGIDFSKKLTLRHKLLAAAGCAAFFLLQLGVCYSNAGVQYGFDSTHIANSALSYIKNGAQVTFYPSYFIFHPHNFPLLLTDIGLLKLVGGSMDTFTQLTYIGNIVLIDISLLLAFLCIRELFGKKSAAVMLLPLCLVIGLNPIMILFYSDTLSMVFPVLVLFLYVRLRRAEKRRARIGLLLLIALCVFIGFEFKITTVILPAAIAVAELLYHIREWKRVMAVALSCALVFGLTAVLDKGANKFFRELDLLQVDMADNPNLHAVPVWDYVMIGLRYPYGTIDSEDRNFTITRPKSTQTEEIKQVIADRLAGYGPAGYIAFLNRKMVYAFGQSSFSIGADGTGRHLYNMPNTLFGKLSQNIFGTSGKWFPVFAYILQGGWVLCLFLIACPLFFGGKKKTDKTVSVLRLALGGILLYLLVSENNPRQLVNQLPLIMILAAWALPKVMRGARSLAGRAMAGPRGEQKPL